MHADCRFSVLEPTLEPVEARTSESKRRKSEAEWKRKKSQLERCGKGEYD
jgi:hypothetical protein